MLVGLLSATAYYRFDIRIRILPEASNVYYTAVARGPGPDAK